MLIGYLEDRKGGRRKKGRTGGEKKRRKEGRKGGTVGRLGQEAGRRREKK